MDIQSKAIILLEKHVFKNIHYRRAVRIIESLLTRQEKIVCTDNFVIFHETCEETDKKYAVIQHMTDKFIKSNPEETLLVDFKPSHFSFLYVDIIFNQTERYSIELETPYNYYVVGNKIDSNILLYLLTKQHTIFKNPDELYIVEFLDNHIKLKYITEEDAIVFEEHTYKIVNSPEN
jgi:predicted nucleic acid-binding protein